jgi:hypothetical protein
MRRRAFITLLGGAAAAWPFAVRAQQPPLPKTAASRASSRSRSRAYAGAGHP